MELPAPIEGQIQSPIIPWLPAEVYGEIMRQHPTLLQQAPYVSKGVARATKSYYMEQQCVDKLVTEEEIRAYINQFHPVNIAGFRV